MKQKIIRKNLNVPKLAKLTDFKAKPYKLRYDLFITTNVSPVEDELNNYDVSIGVKDHNYHLFYGSSKINVIEILNIFGRNYVGIYVIYFYL